MVTGEKPRFPRALALQVARELCNALTPVCERLIVAGSLRRKKDSVGDVEILYIGKTQDLPVPGDMFARRLFDQAEETIGVLELAGVLERRLNSIGAPTFGPQNKLMRHRSTGVPVDLFATTEAAWWNYLVCRTGPAESNTRIASRAQEQGYRWNPYGPGFARLSDGEVIPMASEEAVFRFLNLPFLPPESRA